MKVCVSSCVLNLRGSVAALGCNFSPDSSSQRQNQRKTEEDNRCREEQLLSGHWQSKMSTYYHERKARLTPAASRERQKDTANLHSQSTRCPGRSARGRFDTERHLFFLSATVKVPRSGPAGPVFSDS